MAQATLLLPTGDCFGAQRLSPVTARQLGRGNGPEACAPGRRQQLRRHFRLPADRWPLAALSRQSDVGDAADAIWLRADPAFLRPDMNGVRLIAHGEALALADTDAAMLSAALKPLFGDTGMQLDAAHSHRWYLRLPPGATVPAFSDPGEALGEDYMEHLVDGVDAKRWRSLLNDVQIVLHNHPFNMQRVQQGMVPINALWFWGGGKLPTDTGTSRCRHASVYGDETSLRALTAQDSLQALPDRYPECTDDALYDLTASRDLAWLDAQWLQPALRDLHAGDIEVLELDAEDGRVWSLYRGHRWRFWRRPRERFSP